MAKRRARHKVAPKRRRWKTSRVLTWVGPGCLAVAIIVLGFFAFTGGSSEPRRAVRQQPVVSEERLVTVDVVDNDFEPKHLTVRPGAEVVWKVTGDAAHDVTDDRGAFESGTLRPGDEFRMTFDEPGTYYYKCTLQLVMQGSLVVEP
jgi:plastocyanin